MVTTGGIHALYIVCQALLEPGDEVIVPDPEWPPCVGNIQAAQRASSVPCPLHEPLGWRYDLDELESKITPKTRAIYINSPHNPTGGVLTRDDIERDRRDRRGTRPLDDLRRSLRRRVFDGAEHVSPASLPGMYERTISFYTFSKTYAMTGLRLGYVAVARRDAARPHEEGAVLHRQQRLVGRPVRRHRRARGIAGRASTTFRDGAAGAPRSVLRGHRASTRAASSPATPPRGAFYAFLRIDPAWQPALGTQPSVAVVGDGAST